MLNSGDFVLKVLKQDGVVSPADAERAARYAAEHRVSPGEACVALGIIGSRDLAMARAIVAECAYVDLDHYDIDQRHAQLIPRAAAEKAQAFPLFRLEQLVVVGMVDPLDLAATDRLRQIIGADLEIVLCEPEQLRALIERSYTLSAGFAAEPAPTSGEQASTPTDDEPIVAAVNQIIYRAMVEGASDVHLGADERELHLRYRIDGVLQPKQGPPLASLPGLVQRLKVMANLDLTVTRRPQDGKFRFAHQGRAADIRLSVLPTITGENVVLRLLAGGGVIEDLGALGFPEPIAAAAGRMLEAPHGLILVTGPTGSGKTTTLYSFIHRLNSPELNIVTIEDPVEIRLPLVRQVQVHSEIGMSFAGALRSILRQDPDVILVGEIRDEETARIAVQSALTGHLVLSTLHTNDAAGAIARLRDFTVPGFAINAAVLGVLAQRLVRRVCGACSAPYQPAEALVRRFGAMGEPSPWRRGKGCPKCMGNGYKGRLGIYEFLELTPAVQQAVESGASTAMLRQVALRGGMRAMWMDGVDKARLGMTTLEEVATVVAGSADELAEASGMRLSA